MALDGHMYDCSSHVGAERFCASRPGHSEPPFVLQAGPAAGKKRTHRVRGASLSPRGREQDGAGLADEAPEAGTASAPPDKAGDESEAVDGEEVSLQAPGTPDESVESAGLSPRTLSRGSALPMMLLSSAM